MRGRKIALTAEHIDKLTQAVRVGATYELAARYAGISKDTFDRWRKQAEKAAPGTPLSDLRARLAEAEGRAALGWLAKINRAADCDWRAASWLLVHRYPEQYGRTMQKVAVTDPEGEASRGEGLHALLQQAVIMLPSKSPSPEQWQEDVAALRYPTNRAGSEPRP
jgi:hypothetical protein